MIKVREQVHETHFRLHRFAVSALLLILIPTSPPVCGRKDYNCLRVILHIFLISYILNNLILMSNDHTLCLCYI